jgi:O-Antigen ligase
MRNLVRVLLFGFVFAVPWQYSLELGPPLGNIARLLGVVLIVTAIPAILLAGRIRNPGPIHWLVLALFVWLCCTSFWTIDESNTVVRLRTYFQAMVPFWLVWEFADTSQDFCNLLRAWLAGSWVLAILTIASFASINAVAQLRYVAEGQDPNDVARFLDLGFPLGAFLLQDKSSRIWKWMGIGYFPVGLASVLLTASRGGFLAALVALAGCGLMLARRSRRTVVAATVVLPVAVAMFWWFIPSGIFARIATIPEQIQHGDLNQRLNIWAAGWQAFLHAPVFGAGAGNFVQAARLAPIDTAHNTALSIAVEGGVVSLVLASAILALCTRAVLITRGATRLAMGTAFLVWMVTAMASTVETSRTTWLLLGCLAVAERIAHRDPRPIDAAAEPCAENAGEPA